MAEKNEMDSCSTNESEVLKSQVNNKHQSFLFKLREQKDFF